MSTSLTNAFTDQARQLVTPALRAAVAALCPDMGRVAGYHHGWLDCDGHPTDSDGGKAIRATLALLSARAASGTPEQGVPAAVAVELVHSFSLLHDDVMDGDTERRHRPTAWTVFGSSAAILAGDALLAAAVTALLERPAPGAAAAARRLLDDTQRLITGQVADLGFERRHDVTLDECLRMASDKTAALLSCACSLGAILLGAPSTVVRGLSDFGEHLGVAFQLVDDLLGIWGAPERTGKPVLSDLRSRKKSVPVVAALHAGGPVADELAEIYLGDAPLTEARVVRAAELVERAGGREWTRSQAAIRLDAAEASLVGLALPADVRDELLGVARFVVGRNY